MLPDREIDLLLVDGPPGYGEGMERSRYPALPALEPRLAPGAMVVLDDASRPGEREIIERWTELGWRFGVRGDEVSRSARALYTRFRSSPAPSRSFFACLSSAFTTSTWFGISARCSRIGITSAGRPASRSAWPRLYRA